MNGTYPHKSSQALARQITEGEFGAARIYNASSGASLLLPSGILFDSKSKKNQIRPNTGRYGFNRKKHPMPTQMH